MDELDLSGTVSKMFPAPLLDRLWIVDTAIACGTSNNMLTLKSDARCVQFRSVDRLAYSHAEHEEVTKAIERGAADEAARLMRQHMSLVSASFDSLAHQYGRGGPSTFGSVGGANIA